jgi:uroporphyrinogen III methyltransferase/synthase
VLLARAAGARDVLPRVFAAAGAEVTDAATYRSIPAACLPEAARRALAAGSVDAITFTSASTVESFVALAGGAGAMGAAAIACIGPITAATARRLGLRVAVEAREYTAKGLAAALVDYFSAPR